MTETLNTGRNEEECSLLSFSSCKSYCDRSDVMRCLTCLHQFRVSVFVALFSTLSVWLANKNGVKKAKEASKQTNELC